MLSAVYLAPGLGAALAPGADAALANVYSVLGTWPGAIAFMAQHLSLALLTLWVIDRSTGWAQPEACRLRCIARALVGAVGIGAGLFGLAAVLGAVGSVGSAGAAASVAVPADPITTLRPSEEGAAPWWVSLSVLMVVAYNEELFFRLYLLDRLSRLGASRSAAVPAAAALFGLGHLYQGTTAFVFAVGAGVGLGRLWTKGSALPLRIRLHSFAWGHALYNAAAWLLWQHQFGIHIG